MKGKEVVREIMKVEGETNAALANKLSITPAALWDRLNNKRNKDLSLSILCQMLKILDYKVVVMPRRSPTPKNAYQIQDDTEE